jgi:hypothetical protein
VRDCAFPTLDAETALPRLHDRQRQGATTDVVAIRRDLEARTVLQIYELSAAEVANLQSAY